MDPFKLFPVEIVLLVLSFVTDFVGLESLILSSPWVRAVFEAHPRRIIMSIVRLNPITAMSEIQAQLWRSALIHRPSVHCTDLDSFLRLCPDTRTGPYLHLAPATDALPEQTSVEQIFRLITVAARIQRLACMCMFAMHRNFISAVGDAFGPTSARRAGEPIVWLEEYRVYWALWQLENYAALCKAARSRWSWSTVSFNRLRDITNIDRNIVPLAEHIWSIAAVLESLGLQCSYKLMSVDILQEKSMGGVEPRGHGPETSSEFGDLPDYSPNTIPFFQLLDPLPLQPLLSSSGPQDVYPVWSPPRIPNGESQTEVDWLQGPRHRFSLSPAAMMYQSHRQMNSSRRRFKYATALGSPRLYRLSGVMIWNLWRMYSVGLFTVRFDGTRCTPMGDIVENTQLSSKDFVQRWSALIRKRTPFLKYDVNSVLKFARSSDPH
ncbi:uncharacterized protein N7506_007582 [Penicillium brevicompactum]|uniref:uncharacterized protein n=1 Tax=Penicillium brevicompactum TaxID=5074 RepID=UPI0025408DD9|nr:uncharacterized protein N7506_007582 [Penicillium brevicompactum]KAJ5333799.1 hypothetical protein N7506_007582 [Penicillium brevicompactum]